MIFGPFQRFSSAEEFAAQPAFTQFQRHACYADDVKLRILFFPAPTAWLLVCLGVSGCHAPSSLSSSSEQNRANQQATLQSQREQMEQIPPPSKSRYMAVHTFESWQNPYLTVQPGMLELHVTLADANPSTMGVGGMLRPVGARQQTLNITLQALGEAITAVPQTAWPYGRVLAIEEAHKTPASAEPAVRRNMEAAINRLNELGIVAYDLEEGKIQ
jgi:hypothetical protein